MIAKQANKDAYLFTGKPQVGKSTAVKKIINTLGVESCGGFYTEEIRVQGARMGFRLVTLDGQTGLMAHRNLVSPFRIGSYGVDITCLDTFGVTAVYTALERKKLIVIDEIGPMELFSEQFKQAVLDILASSLPILGTIALRPHPWLDMIKQHRRVLLYELTVDNRDQIVRTVSDGLGGYPS